MMGDRHDAAIGKATSGANIGFGALAVMVVAAASAPVSSPPILI